MTTVDNERLLTADHLVEDYTRVLFAVALEQVTWDRSAQRYRIGQINEDAIDHAMAAADNRR